MSVLHNVVVGISYRTAKTQLRDRLSLDGEKQSRFREVLCGSLSCVECVILSTCNRTEFYLVLSGEPEAYLSPILDKWSAVSGVPQKEIENVCYTYTHLDGVKHLYRVIASLDSLVMGEGQIMGQVKDAYFAAQKSGHVGMYLNQLFQSAFALGKAVRTETAINEGAVSISYAAVELCKKVFPRLNSAKVAVVGTGEMGFLAAQHLRQAGVVKFDFFNRTLSKAVELAEEFDAEAFGLEQLTEKLSEYDIVIAATGSSHPILFKKEVEKAVQKRSGAHLILVDIAMPRDIDPEVQNVSSAYLFDIDDLQEAIKDNQNKRLESALAAEDIIENKLKEFTLWYHSQKIVPTLVDLKNQLTEMGQAEIKRLRNKIGEDHLSVAQELLHGIVGKWLHYPMEELKELSEEGYSQEANRFVERLFHLGEFKKRPPQKN